MARNTKKSTYKGKLGRNGVGGNILDSRGEKQLKDQP